MSEGPSNWWNRTTEESVKRILEYMAVMPYAVLATSVNARALGELNGTVEQKDVKNAGGIKEVFLESDSDEDLDTQNREKKAKIWGLKGTELAHAVCFTRDEAHPDKHPLCMINAGDIKRVERMLWWLQLTQPRALQLQHVEQLSADELRQVLDLLFTDTPALPGRVPLYTNLLEFSVIAPLKDYECTNILQALGKCTSLEKLDLCQCKSLLNLEGLEKFPHLQQLSLSKSKINDLTWLRSCAHLKSLRTIKLRSCRNLKTTAGIEGLQNLEHIDLTFSSVENLVGLESCGRIRTVIVCLCMFLRDFSALQNLPLLETLLAGETRVSDISFLSTASRLMKLDLHKTFVQDLTPLQNCTALKAINVSKCKNVQNVEALKGLVNLKYLSLALSSVGDIAPLAGCTKLKHLELSWNSNVRSLTALAHMSNLERLTASNTSVDDLTPLAHCTRLKLLDLQTCNGVRSVAPLADMIDLRVLILSGTSVEDLMPLQRCANMRSLDIVDCTNLHDLCVLQNMPLLKSVLLSSSSEVITTGLSEKTLGCFRRVL